ncbi:hypothetical protein [Methylobacterium sp. Leaf91]|uniref:hypothetical protein n=1 Tax=Methylobacterium sp. Leaf91 TaxID=1736247 RepID=UPI0006F317D6|nr:hypothetical protein [Methylobacterium sp. Leaf91]KQO99127.1 hypothetical protein ASF32_14835 [Methylobacterium sp. Leaf91]
MSAPWIKFYPSDWLSKPALRLCPMAARGLWMEMLCIMHNAEPYGHLVVMGRPLTDSDLARMVGMSLKECRKSLATLALHGIYSVTADGTIYSRRMVRDNAKALKDKENGKRGGNPDLNQGVNPPDKGEDKAQNPEARIQIEEEGGTTVQLLPEKPEPDTRAAASRSSPGANRYFFESGVIRLNEPDFRKWDAAFPSINLRAELTGLTGWAGDQTSWFFAVPGALAKRDREARLAVERFRADAEAKANAPKPRPCGYVP